MPPAVRRRRRDAEGGRGRLQRKPLLDPAHEREPPSQSELGVSVQIHPCPPLSVSPGRPTTSKEGRIEPQPFTTSIGGTTRPLRRRTQPLLNRSPAARARGRRRTRRRRRTGTPESGTGGSPPLRSWGGRNDADEPDSEDDAYGRTTRGMKSQPLRPIDLRDHDVWPDDRDEGD